MNEENKNNIKTECCEETVVREKQGNDVKRLLLNM